jgi:hypothetical protein
MDEAALLYRGSPESARSLADRLDVRGIDCVIDDHYRAGGHDQTVDQSYSTLHVSVSDEAEAIEIRSAWLASSKARAAGLSQRLFVLATWSFLPAVAWLAVAILRPASVPEPLFERLMVVTGASFVLFAQVEHRWRAFRGVDSRS